jgi:tetratricopeptide (TPR) repeat protein
MKKISNNMIIRYVSVLFIFWVTFSCSDDFFNQQAGNRISPDLHYQSVTDLEVSFNGVLSPLQVTLPNLFMIDGLRTDLMDITANADGDLVDLYNQKFDSANPMLDVSGLYKVIVNANEVLVNLYRVTKADPNFDEYYQKEVRGALIGLRAWAYFQLVRLNGEAAYIPDNLVELPANMAQTFIPKDAMIDTLINQLIPFIHTDESKIELRIELYPNTKALLGELYLEKNDYANAAFYLKMSMESFGNDGKIFKLDKTFAKESWMNIFIGGASGMSENIGVVLFNASEIQPNPLAEWMLPTNKYMVKPTSVLWDLYMAQIQLKKVVSDQYRGIGVTIDTLSNSGERYISKYSLQEGIDAYSSDLIYMRCGDIHLKLAEALNRMGQNELAMILLNQGISAEKKRPVEYTKWASNVGVRGRAYLASRTIPVEITDPARITETIEDFIIEERAMELAYEGSRMFDLIRIAKRRGNPDYLAAKVAAKYSDQGKAEMIRAKLQNEANWYLPLSK